MVAQARRLKAPFAYYGGKQALAPLIVSLLPPHETYVEVFGGAASVLWAKPPSPLEVYNDLDSGVVNFFRVLRDPKRATRLQELLELTPYSREEWEECYHSWRIASDEVEMARRWFTAIEQSFSKHLDASGWSFTTVPHCSPARKVRSHIAGFQRFTQRLAEVQIEHADSTEMLARYDGPRTLFYLDPPYVLSTRGRTAYQHEMTPADHDRMLSAITATRGMVLLSGYRNEQYEEALAGWTRISAAVVSRGANRKTGDRTECIWISPNANQRQLTLFD